MSFAFGVYRKIGRRQGEKLSLKICKAGQVTARLFLCYSNAIFFRAGAPDALDGSLFSDFSSVLSKDKSQTWSNTTPPPPPPAGRGNDPNKKKGHLPARKPSVFISLPAGTAPSSEAHPPGVLPAKKPYPCTAYSRSVSYRSVLTKYG